MKIIETLYAGNIKLSVVALSDELMCECKDKTFSSGYAIKVTDSIGREELRVKLVDDIAEPYSTAEEASEALYYVRYELLEEKREEDMRMNIENN